MSGQNREKPASQDVMSIQYMEPGELTFSPLKYAKPVITSITAICPLNGHFMRIKMDYN